MENGQIEHRVMRVHMVPVSARATEKARLILVSTGIGRRAGHGLIG